MDDTNGGHKPPASLDEMLEAIRWTRSDLARALEVDTSTVDTWARKHRTDTRILPWLRKLAAYHAKYPRPEGWTKRPLGNPNFQQKNRE